MPNQMIALQARNPQLPDPSRQTAQFANMMNMARQQEAAALQAQRARQEMQYAEAAEGRAVAGEKRDVAQFGAEQPARVAGALGSGLVGILHNPSDETIAQAAQTFTSVGMEQDKFGPILKQIQAIPDPNARKLFVMQFISQSEPARAALKFVMPEVKSEKVGDATVFYDANPASPIMGQELFRFTAAPEPVKMTQQVVDSTLYNVNPVTGVAAEALIGDPTQNRSLPAREPTFASTGVRSPYAVGGGMGAGQPSMAPPTAPPAQAVGIPVGGPRGAPAGGQGGDVFSRMIQQESRGKQFDRAGRPLTSSAGAIGIAQVMPGTAPEAAKLAGLPFDQNRYRNDPEYNLALGKAYYEKQLRDFGGDERLAAAAYNAGPGAVRSALKKGGPDGWINNIPRETRNYLDAVFGGARAPARTPTVAGTPTSAAPQPQTIGEQQRRKGFVKTLELFDYDAKTGKDSISPLIKASTSGGLEKIGADISAFIPKSMGGGATPGAIAIGQLQSLQDSMTFEKLRGKLGAQISDADVKLVANTMGDIANPNIPWDVRLAKWQNVVLPILVRGAGMTYVKPKGGSSGGGTKVIKTLTPDQVRAAPSGTRYKTTDGRELTKP
jgi:hypothetical protein